MSGLFRRLARQAAGSRPATVHAMARLPFHAPPALVAPDEGGAPMPLARAPAADPAPTPPSATAARSTHPAAPARSRHRGHAEPVSPVAPAIDTPSADTPAPLVALCDDEPSPPAEPARPRPRQADTDIHGPAAPAAAATVAVAASAPAWRVEVPPAAAGRAPREPTADAAGPGAFPEALLPPQAAAAPPAAQAARPANPPSPVRPAPAAEPTEVHVHIGRIEVTAVQAPAPSRRPARGGQAPMSLDAYLAKRQRSPS